MTGIGLPMQRKGLKLNPFLTMYYIAPASFGVLSVLWIFVEREAVMAHHFVSLSSQPL